jgi:hypothetical protein
MGNQERQYIKLFDRKDNGWPAHLHRSVLQAESIGRQQL